MYVYKDQSWVFIGRSDVEGETHNTLATWCEELTHWKRPWCWERLTAGGEVDDRGWDGWMASPTQWTWVWMDSGSWWWTWRPGMLQLMGSQESNMTEQLNWLYDLLMSIDFFNGNFWWTDILFFIKSYLFFLFYFWVYFLCAYANIVGWCQGYIISFISFLRLSSFLPFFLSIFFFLSNNFAQPKCDEFPYMIQICRNFYRSMCSEVLVEFYLTL